MPDFSSPAWTPQPNIYGATVQATQVPDYAAKRRLAEALRGQADRYQAQEMQPAAYSTRGSGAYPGQTDVNWGGILQNAFNSYQGASKDKKATAVAGEMEATRNEALDAALKNGSINDPKTLIALSQMGVEPDVLKLAQGPATKTPARLNFDNVQDVLYARDNKEITQQQADAYIAAIREEQAAKDARAEKGAPKIYNTYSNNEQSMDSLYQKNLTEQISKNDANTLKDVETRLNTLGETRSNNAQISAWANNDAAWSKLETAARMAGTVLPDQLVSMAYSDEYRTASAAAATKIRDALKDVGGNDSNSDLAFAKSAEATSAMTQSQAKALAQYQEAMTDVAELALRAKRDWMRNPENMKATAKAPDFWSNARAEYAGRIDSAKASFLNDEKILKAQGSGKSTALPEGDDEI